MIGEIVNSAGIIRPLKLTAKGIYVNVYPQRGVLGWSVKQLRHTLNIYRTVAI